MTISKLKLGLPKELKFVYHGGIHHFYNKNREANKHKPTSYTFGILTDDTAFEYMFSNTSERICEERLTEHSPKDETTHFHRKYNPDTDKYDWTTFSDAFVGKTSETVREFMVRKNNLFLSSAANLPEDKKDRLPIADKIYQWFRKNSAAWTLNLQVSKWEYDASFGLIKEDEKNEKLFLEMLEHTDFIVKNIKIEDKNGSPGLSA